MTDTGTMDGNDLLRLLKQMDVIDDLLTILDNQSGPDPIVGISVAPWAWSVLHRFNIEIHYINFGGPIPDEDGIDRNMDGAFLNTEDNLVSVRVEPDQAIAYRLWDRKGRELVADPRGWFYVVSGGSRG